MGFYGILWFTKDLCFVFLGDSMGFYGIYMDFTGFFWGIHWDFTGLKTTREEGISGFDMGKSTGNPQIYIDV